MANPADLNIVCGEWNIDSQPELFSVENEVVLPVLKIINHHGYSEEEGPGAGNDIAVYYVDDTLLKQV